VQQLVLARIPSRAVNSLSSREVTMATESNDPFGPVEALYNQNLDGDKTKKVHTLLKELKGSPETDAKHSAYKTIFLHCDYLNRWNEVGKADLDKVSKEIQTVVAKYPEFAPAHYAHGFLHRAKGKHEAALESFTKATKLDPGYARAYAQKGAELLYLGLPEMALAEVRKAIELSPGSPTHGMYYWIRGRAYFFMGNYEEAIPWLKQSIETWKTLWYNRLYLVSAHALKGEEANAKRELDDFASQFPKYTIARVIKNEETNPNKIPFVVEGRRKFHLGLLMAGMPP
jgi:tetratricopeptide (TPR) repeat protein